MLSPIMQAPHFSLPNAEGTEVSFSDYLGNWVLLYFYPKDDTPGCTTEACAIRDNFPFYEDLGIAVIGISKDSVESHRKFKEKHQLPFELLSDEKGAVSELYHSGIGDTPKRISYLINPEGFVVKAYAEVDPLTHAATVLKDLKEITQAT